MNKENIKNIYFNNFKIKALYSGENLIFRSSLIEKNIYEYSLINNKLNFGSLNFGLDVIPDISYNNSEVPIILKISAINKPDIILEGKKSSFSVNMFEGYKTKDIRKIEIEYDKADFISNPSRLKYYLEYVYNIDISLSKNIDSLFSNCVNLKEIPYIDISEVNSLNNLFYNCNNMEGYADPYKYWNLRQDLDDSKHENCFYNCRMLSNYKEIPMSWNGFDSENEYKNCLVCYTFDRSKESNHSFSGITHLPIFDFISDNTKYSVEDEDLGNNLIRRKIKTEYPCERVSFSSNKSVLSVEYLNTDYMIGLSNTFYSCSILEKVDLSLSNTARIRSFAWCFQYCENIKEINLGNINVENLSDTIEMFSGCTNLSKLNIDNWKTDYLDDTMYMFANCKSLKEIDISHFDTKKVYDSKYMFSGCSSLNMVNMKNFKTDKLTKEGVSLMFVGVPNTCVVYVDSNFVYSESDCGFQGTFTRDDVKDVAIVNKDYPRNINYWAKKGVYFYKDEENLIHIRSKEGLEDYEDLLREKNVFYYDLSNVVNFYKLFYNSKLSEKNIIIDLNNRIINKDFDYAFYGIEYYNKNSSSTLINSFKLLNVNFGILNNGDKISAEYMFNNSNIENIDLSEIILDENIEFELKRSFSDCINLKRLDLSNIGYIYSAGSFYNLPSLEYLNLSNVRKFYGYTDGFSELNRNCEILLNENIKLTEDNLGFKGLFKRTGSEEVCKYKAYVYKEDLEDPNYSYFNLIKDFLDGAYNKYLNSPIQFEVNRNMNQTILDSEGRIRELIEVTVSSYSKDCLSYKNNNSYSYEYFDKFYISDRNYYPYGIYDIKLIDNLYFMTNKINSKNFYLYCEYEYKDYVSTTNRKGYINNVHIEDKLDITSASGNIDDVTSGNIEIIGIKNYFDFNNKLILPNTINRLYLQEINCESFNLSNIEFLKEVYIANCTSLKSIDFSDSILPKNITISNVNLENINFTNVSINNLDSSMFYLIITGELIKELDLTFIDNSFINENSIINLSGISKDCIVKVKENSILTEEECSFKGTFTRV